MKASFLKQCAEHFGVLLMFASLVTYGGTYIVALLCLLFSSSIVSGFFEAIIILFIGHALAAVLGKTGIAMKENV